ncbi:MAG: hypothetical protein K0Q68_3172 [Moraxellaceae bacterium]|nr:hypothetical protein [Moraxellaceae bacterium]
MPHFTRAQRRRWSLPLVVVLLLHWTFGVCEAMAEVLCFEPDGKVVLEIAGEPCASAELEQVAGKPCFDLKADSSEPHESVPASPPAHADLQPLLFIPALTYLLEVPQELRLAQPAATGPPISTSLPALRRTTVLLI